MAWALAIALIYSSMVIVLSVLYVHFSKPQRRQMADGSIAMISSEDNHLILRIGFLGLVATYMFYMVGVLDNILKSANITDAAMRTLVDSTITIVGWLLFLFVSYLFIFMVYYLATGVQRAWSNKKQKRFNYDG